MTTFVIILTLRLDGLSSAPHDLVHLLLEGSFVACYLPLPARWEVAGIRLWEGLRKLKRCGFCSSKLFLLLLEQNGVHVADCNSIVLCYARWALAEKKDCLHGSSFDHLLTTTVKATLRRLWLPRWRRRLFGVITIFPRHLPALMENRWPIEEPPRLEKREGQLSAPQQRQVHLVLAR